MISLAHNHCGLLAFFIIFVDFVCFLFQVIVVDFVCFLFQGCFKTL